MTSHVILFAPSGVPTSLFHSLWFGANLLTSSQVITAFRTYSFLRLIYQGVRHYVFLHTLTMAHPTAAFRFDLIALGINLLAF